MIELSKEQIEEIKGLVEKITKRSIEDQNDPNGFCFSTCFALSILLEGNGYSNSIIGGKMNNCDHFWLRLEGYNQIIIDATFIQFDKEKKHTSTVYIGKINDNEITAQYEQEYLSFNQWIDSYRIWSNPPIDKNGDPRDNDLVTKLILNNIIAASILNFEIENMEEIKKDLILKSLLCRLYFQPILKGLKNKWQTDNDLVKMVNCKVSSEFKLLLSKVR